MEFAFTEDQLEFRDVVRGLLANECPPTVVRDAWTNADGRSGGTWAALAEMGVLGALVPEADGGLGLSELDAVLLAEETGYAALPEPFVEHVLVGAPIAVAEHGGVVDGSVLVSAGDPYAPCGAAADVLVFLAPDAQVVTGASLEPQDSVDHSRRLTRLVDASATRPLTRPELSQAFWRGSLGYSAQLVGLARRMLDMTVEYVAERKQFGAPIGSFQAVKHHLADVRIAIEFAAPLVYRAADSLATRGSGSDAPRLHGQGPGCGRGHARGACRAPVSRRHRLLVRVRPAPLDEARLGARRHLGRRGLAP